MKNAINLMLTMMFLLTLSTAFSLNAAPIGDTNGLIVKVAPSEQGRAIELRMSNLQKQFTKVKIVDVWGYTLLSEKVAKENGYSKLVNLENLPIGDYVLRIEHPSGAFNHAFHLGGEAVSFFDSIEKNGGFTQLTKYKERHEIYKVRFTSQKNNLNVMLQELDKATAHMHVCNMSGRFYFKEKFKGGTDLDRQIALENLPQGEYMLVVRSDKNTIIQPFEKTEKGLVLKNTLVSKPIVVGGMEVYSQR